MLATLACAGRGMAQRASRRVPRSGPAIISTGDLNTQAGAPGQPDESIVDWLQRQNGPSERQQRTSNLRATATAAAAAVPEPSATLLEPSYEWALVPDGMMVPPGLDIEMPLDGRPKRARIPPTWRMQLWSEGIRGFFRTDVRRQMTVAELNLAMAASRDLAAGCVSLAELNGVPLPPELSVEEVRLFHRLADKQIEAKVSC